MMLANLWFRCRKDAQNANISSKLEDEQNTTAQLQKRLKELQVGYDILHLSAVLLPLGKAHNVCIMRTFCLSSYNALCVCVVVSWSVICIV